VSDLARSLAHALDPVGWVRDELQWCPDPWQGEVLSQTEATLLCCSRQSGKSTTTAALAAHCAVTQPGSLILLVAPTQRQSGLLYRKVSRFLKSLEPVEHLEADNRLSCVLRTGSEVISLPGEPDNLRGYSGPQLVLLDEAAYLDEGVMEAVLPMLAVSDGRLVLLSSPNGSRGYFYRAWTGQEGDWHRIKATADDCPRISSEYLAKMRKRLPEFKFMQEFYGVFADGENQLFATDLIDAAFNPAINALFPQNKLNALRVPPAGAGAAYQPRALEMPSIGR
jgi:hypothetical protein